VFFTAVPTVRVPFAPRIRPGHHLEFAVPSTDPGVGRDVTFPQTRLLTPTRSSLSGDARLDFMVRLVPGGMLSERLRSAEVGTIVLVSLPKPSGLLIVPHARATKVILLGAGTGIAAFLSYFRARAVATPLETDPEVTLVSLHRSHPLAGDELESIAAGSGGRLKLITMLSQPPSSWVPGGSDGGSGPMFGVMLCFVFFFFFFFSNTFLFGGSFSIAHPPPFKPSPAAPRASRAS
jgi:ferredoxin-NADP reductase